MKKAVTQPAPLSQEERTALALRVSRVTIYGNVLLTLGKLAAGVFAHSGALLSDAVHSASDVLTTLIVMLSVHLAGKQEDSDHEYGHERLEAVASVLLAAALALVGAAIGVSGIQAIFSSGTDAAAVPGGAALAAAAVSIVVKELMFRYTRAAARRTASTALMADAWHHRSDTLSSVGSFLGVAAARLGFPLGDPIASLVICGFIFKVSLDIFRDAVSQLTDRACSPEVEKQMRTVICAQPGVLGLDLLKTRRFGARVYVDVEIAADASLTLAEAHAIAERVHDVIEKSFLTVKHCMVHVNPRETGGAH